MSPDDVVLITGAKGLVGKNLESHFRALGYERVVAPGKDECDLTDFDSTKRFFSSQKPDYVFHMAGRVRGLMGNLLQQGPAYFDNVLINTHVIEASRLAGVKKILAMGTVAVYPDPLPGNPLREDMIFMGTPHGSEYGYAQAKRGMLAQLETYKINYGLPFVFAVSTNLYGPHDRFDVKTGHVVPALVKKFHEAKRDGGNVVIWGDGTPRRDFLYVDDAVRGCRVLMDEAEGVVNLATGTTHQIRDVVEILADITGVRDRIVWDNKMPNGQIDRSYDVSKLHDLGFKSEFDLRAGLEATYAWFSENAADARVS